MNPDSHTFITYTYRSNKYNNHKVRSAITQIQHRIIKVTYLMYFLHQYIRICPTHSTTGVRAHSCRLFQASAHTAAEPLRSTLLPRLGLTTALQLFTHYMLGLFFSKTKTELPFPHRASLYLYFPLARDPTTG